MQSSNYFGIIPYEIVQDDATGLWELETNITQKVKAVSSIPHKMYAYSSKLVIADIFMFQRYFVILEFHFAFMKSLV